MMTFSQAQIDSARASAPRSVQDMLEQGTLLMTLVEIGKARGLHVDQFGVAADLTRNMLIGLLGPAQFVSDLREAGVAEAVANAMLQDLNTKVFKPLNEKVRGTEPKPAQPQARPAPQTPRATPPVQTPPPKPPVPLPPKPAVSVAPQPVPPQPKPIPSPVAQPTPRPTAAPAMRTMAHDVEEMKEGKVPPPFFANPVPPAAPVSVPPPAPRPVPPVFPTTPPPPREVPSLTPTAEEVSSSLKKYGIDPYREAVE